MAINRRDQELEQQRRRLAQVVGQEVSTIVLSVVSGVISGEVSVSANGQELNIRDERLRDQIRRFHFVDVLIDVVAKVSAVWERLTSRLSRLDIADEQERAKSMTPESDTGLQPRNYGYEP